ncbi:hypothetical protein AB3R30_16720 [Leptolyngbyaceae cyanobacterium UHCC 1019]
MPAKNFLDSEQVDKLQKALRESELAQVLLNASMICPHPQPFSRWEKGARSLVPSPAG